MGTDANAIQSDRGAFWVQPDGPNTEPKYLGCVDIETIAAPKGDVTQIMCHSPAGDGTWQSKGSSQARPGNVTLTVAGLLFKTASWLEDILCAFPWYITLSECDRLDVFDNWVRAFAQAEARVTSESLGNLARREETAAATESYDLAGPPPVLRLYQMTTARQSIAETEELTAIRFCNARRCVSGCGPAKALATDGLLVSKAAAGSPTNVANAWATGDGGGTWSPAAANPFAAAYDIAALACFSTGRNTTQHVVARGTTVVAAPAAVAVSSTGGATWTTHNVGAVNGQYVTGPHALFALDYHHLWLVTTDGYVYFSADGGGTWAAQDAGVATAQDLNAVHFATVDVGVAGGNANAILKTSDGGESWSAVSGPVAQAAANVTQVWCIDQYNFWVTYSDGRLYFTTDGGVTWTERVFDASVAGTGAIADLKFASALVGYLLHNTAAPVGTVYQTINGGYSWQAVDDGGVSNAGLNYLYVADHNTVFAVGKAAGGTGVVLKLYGQK